MKRKKMTKIVKWMRLMQTHNLVSYSPHMHIYTIFECIYEKIIKIISPQSDMTVHVTVLIYFVENDDAGIKHIFLERKMYERVGIKIE